MQKVDKTIIKETIFIACWAVIFSLIMQSVFLVIKKWDYTVVLGNLLSIVVSVGNFFLLGLTVQKATQKEEKEAKQFMKLSQTGRMFIIFVVCILGALLSCFNIFATLVPLIFPRLAIMIRMFTIKKGGGSNE